MSPSGWFESERPKARWGHRAQPFLRHCTRVYPLSRCSVMKAFGSLVALVSVVILPVSMFAAELATFGAKGDGRADDTDAIQRAVDAGGSVRFPSGTFRLTRTVTIDLDKTGFVTL